MNKRNESGSRVPAEKKRSVTAAGKRAARLKARRRRTLLLSALFFLTALGILVWAVSLLLHKDDGGGEPAGKTPAPVLTAAPLEKTFPKNASVNGVSVACATVEEARALLAEPLAAALSSCTVTLQSDITGTKVLSAEQAGLSYDLDNALEAAEAGGDIRLTPVLDRAKLTESLQSVTDSVQGHAENASFSIEFKSYKVSGTEYTKPRFVYTEGKEGKQFDLDGIASQIESALAAGNTNPVIVPEITVSEPAITVASLKKKTTLLAQFSTTYYFRGTGSTTQAELENRMARDANISKAVGLMNCIVLKPKESFSFNTATGKRSLETGWTDAKAVYRGGYRPEPGGGVCQVSTTMFNALTRSGVTITSHSEHSIPSDYVDLGWDATVDYGHIDFKFKNNKSDTLYVFVYIKQGSSSRKKDIVVEVYGPEEIGISYQPRSELLATDPAVNPVTKIDKKQPVDYSAITQNPHDGYTVAIYIDKYKDGRYDSTPFSYTAIYKKIEQVTTVGGRPTDTPKPTKTPKPTTPPPYISYG